jgi:hypothetical protein
MLDFRSPFNLQKPSIEPILAKQGIEGSDMLIML